MNAPMAQNISLTHRQAEVLALVSAGLTDTEIAGVLEISPRTARMHCDVLRRKLGVTKRRLIPLAYRTLTGHDPLLAGAEYAAQGEHGRPLP